MNDSIYQLLTRGRKYVSLWPDRSELMQYFPQYRAVALCRLVVRYFPLLAITLFALVYSLSSGQAISLALFYFIFLASMPLQGLFLMGKKSQERLPPALASWYREGVNKLKEQHQKKATKKLSSWHTDELNVETKEQQSRYEAETEQLVASMAKPVFMDLALLLSITYQNQRY